MVPRGHNMTRERSHRYQLTDDQNCVTADYKQTRMKQNHKHRTQTTSSSGSVCLPEPPAECTEGARGWLGHALATRP